jgi:hypothetical protein
LAKVAADAPADPQPRYSAGKHMTQLENFASGLVCGQPSVGEFEVESEPKP